MIDLNAILDTESRIKIGNFLVSSDQARARQLFLSVLDIDKDNVAALCNAAFMAMKAKDMEASVQLIDRALSIEPEHPHTLGIAGLIAQETPAADKFQKAREYFEHSLKNNPREVTVHLNYAYMLQLVGDYRRALEIYTQARDLNVMDMNTRFQRSMCMLTMAETPEQWREALDEYEIRNILYNTRAGANKQMWTGKESGTCHDHLLIVCEQGIGDAVMCGRFARELILTQEFDAVSFLCRPGMEDLLKRLHGVSGVYTDLKDVPDYQYYIPALSLLRAEGWPGNKPSNAPYLSVNKSFEFGSAGASKLKVGLCWEGNKSHGNDRWRSIGPDLFSDAFADITGVEFYSLHTSEVNRFRPEFVHDCNIETLGAFADVIQSMDMIVTVDTAALHVAGALGKPTLAFLASNGDWRWGVGSSSTDWYPSVELMRADKPLNWKPVLEKAARKVQMYADQHKAGTS